ncbi:MAG: polysaccharide biosynthesis/export family protein [Verrucomicrobiota bacterium]
MRNMKLSNWFRFGLVACALAIVGILATSCRTGGTGPGPVEDPPSIELRVGETVRVIFSNGSTTQIPPHEEQIKQDGTITLVQIGSVRAAGKTSGELQTELQKAYSKYYRDMNVTVQVPDRSYSVGGQVKAPDRKPYVGPTTVIKAIQSAGDFTDFANRKKVRLTRANGKSYIVNCIKALENPKLDLPVYPGDSIHVPQRRL